jgi:50S ribosomal protein L16 3-hydroxylase
MTALRSLGPVSIGRFLREYWQRRPLLIRRAFAGFEPPVGRDRLFALAGREDVESRLVTRRRGGVALRHGPFTRRALPPLSRGDWTLLVQGVDLVEPAAQEFMQRFRFLSDARLDDLMASFATDGGGVGPHADNYDVFLLQVSGRRRWRISRQHDQQLVPGVPVKLLADFRPTQEWLLEPGDLLYLPPGVAHDGIAVGECITWSIGFRTPTWQELLDPWFAAFAEQAAPRGRYTDPRQRPTRHPGSLPSAMVERVHDALIRQRPTRAHTARFLLEHLSEPKSHVVFTAPGRRPSLAAFTGSARRRGIRLDPRTRMLTGRAGVAMNGELFTAESSARPLLQRLADRRALDARSLRHATPGLLSLLREWLLAGWLHLDRSTPQ